MFMRLVNYSRFERIPSASHEERRRVARAVTPMTSTSAHPKTGSTSVFGLIVLLLLVGSMSHAFAGVKADGSYSATQFAPDNSKLLHSEYTFSFISDGPRWRCRVTPTSRQAYGFLAKQESSKFLPFDYLEAAGDGVVFRAVIKPNSALRGPRQDFVAQAVIGNGPVPHALPGVVILLWYSLSSGDYFKTNSAQLCLPLIQITEHERYAEDARVSYALDLHPSPLGLPRFLATRTDYRFLSRNPESPFGKHGVYTNAILTSVSRQGPPAAIAEATIRFLGPPDPLATNGQRTGSLHVIRTSEAESASLAAPNIVTLPGISHIVDARVWTLGTHSTVAFVSDKWPELLGSTLLQARKDKFLAAGRTSRSKFLMVAFALTGLFALLARMYYRRSATQQSNI